MPAALRRLARLPLLLALAFAGLAIQLLVFPLADVSRRRAIVRLWSRALLAVCGLRLRVHQDGGVRDARSLLDTGPMVVANHVSWLDIFVIDSVATCAFVAKSEVRRWPLAGWLAAMAGTVFIERARRHAVHKVIERLRQRLRERFPVAVFPEATTSTGSSLRPFHGNLLEAAIAEAVPVVPMALRYRDERGQLSEAAAYVDDMTFIESLWLVTGMPYIVAEVHVLAPVPAAGRNRHQLARELRALISGRLELPLEDSVPGTVAAFRAASH